VKTLPQILLFAVVFGTSAGVFAAGGTVSDPNGIAPDRYVYYPGTEALGPDEIRLHACGTGMPAARHKQAATCWLIELGNGDKFFFDVGTHSMGNVASLMIPYDYLDKVFITHLHSDHWGDLASLWIGGWTAGRNNPLQVWGPSGAEERLGTAHAVKHFQEAYYWDWKGRLGALAEEPGNIEVTEFDYTGANHIVYDKNGVVVRAWPAIHSLDGPVSYSLEWNDYKVVFGGDTFPNKWYLEYARDADAAIHECFHLPTQMVEKYNQAPIVAMNVATKIHTSPQAFGKIMSTVKPKHAIAYHFFNDDDTRYEIFEGVREVYDGPLSLAVDGMMWNITRKGITERMTVMTEDAWSVPGSRPPPPGDPSKATPISDKIRAGAWSVEDVEVNMLREFMEKYDIDPDSPKQGN
jgi:ribonuclease Z